MGELVDTVFGRRDADALEKIDGQRAGLARRQPLVQPFRLGDLVAYVNTGLSDVIGSWKIMEIRLPRT